MYAKMDINYMYHVASGQIMAEMNLLSQKRQGWLPGAGTKDVLG